MKAYDKADRLVSEALWRETVLEKKVEGLREQSGEVPSLKA